jgi:hypothetical protein
MILTFLGLVLILIPFLLVFRFKNHVLGFVYILGSILTIHLCVAFLTQFFHFFLYPVVITIHSIIALVTLYILLYKSPNISFKLSFNWFAIFSFLIIIFQLWSVHFFYTGTVSTINDYKTVSRGSYPYPYFSDEWSGVAFSNYSINNNALPIVNPLININKNNNFPNIFIFFFSLISELFLVLNISPLLGYAFFSIAAGFIICLLIFTLLRVNKVSLFPSLLAALCVPYIVNGLNLPGIWYLLPFIGGSIFFLLSLIGFSIRNNVFALVMSVVSLLLYPPMIIFVAPIYIAYLIFEKELKSVNKIKTLLISLVTILLIIGIIIYSQGNNINGLFHILTSSIWRLNLDGGIPAFAIWNIIPIIILPFALVGLIKILKEKNIIILIPTVIGIILWSFYNYSQYYFIIDYARVVVVTSFFIMILAGFGFEETSKKIIKRYSSFFNKNTILLPKIFLILMFLVLSFYYTDNLTWKSLVLRVTKSDSSYVFIPGAPAAYFLAKDDVKLFSSISKERFLSPPWKGLVIGVATNNYPMDSKSSIITNSLLGYDSFMNETCADKVTSSQYFNIKYIYSYEFNCDKFTEIGQSYEGLHLYKFEK